MAANKPMKLNAKAGRELDRANANLSEGLKHYN